MYVFTLTTSSSVQPAAARHVRTFSRHCRVCSVMPPSTSCPSGPFATWPAVHTMSPEATTGEYGGFGVAIPSG